MKKLILAVIALLMNCAPVMAQTIAKGDMDDNGILDISDVSKLISTVLGERGIEYFNVNTVDNSQIQGTWYLTKTNSITFNADSTTDYLGAYKYKYMPYKDQIRLYNSDGSLEHIAIVTKLTTEELVLMQDGTTSVTYYRTQPAQLVTGITLSRNSLFMRVNSTSTLTATVSPADAENQELSWSSSDVNVATVANGVVTGVSSGKATITASANDGSGVSATCEVEVSSTSAKTYTVNGVSFNMIIVEGGTFQMGATEEQGSEAADNESPVHSVTLSGYAIGETEVTQALWYAVMGKKPLSNTAWNWSSTYGLGDNYPAYNISYTDCEEFITKLNALTGETFRLPTEAEWEYAARGGANSKGYKYAGSNTIDDVAWYLDNSGGTNHVVATKAPNELGLYDMSGNVLEWCYDWWGIGYYTSEAQTNPTGPESGSYHINRGGNLEKEATYCRVSCRGFNTPGNRYYTIGMRLAK